MNSAGKVVKEGWLNFRSFWLNFQALASGWE